MTALDVCLWCGGPATTIVPACTEHGTRDRVEGAKSVKGILVGVALGGLTFSILLAALILAVSR